MLDLGFQEFILIAFVLLIVVGPKDLPKVLRSITGLVRKIKSMASDFHSGIDDLANEAEISDLRKEVSNINDKKLISSEIEDLKGFQNIDDLDMGSLKKDVNEIKNINLSDSKRKTKAKTNKI
ncbi:MAG: Sec-independent protein translocase protein TatB [Candidatus Puniceispirillales bacterium]|jgi:Tat protein translocase TatB subunit|tara:strand:- start:461 stop:829 length:369 start_codon:yes stop_codon:yes gene_type:complete